MASRVLFRQAPRLASAAGTRTAAPMAARRFLNTDSAPVLYTASAQIVGARSGHLEGENLTVDLAIPKSLGGPGGKTNPEELFAMGYGACFQSAMNASAASLGIKMPKNSEDSRIETKVHLVGDLKALDMGIKVDMKVSVKGMEKADIEKVVQKTKEVCPYSRATQGNVTTNVEVEVL